MVTSQPSQPLKPIREHSVTRLLPGAPPGADGTGPESGGGSQGHLLSVRAAAGLLGVSRATVYALCETGRLPHLRVGNAIRIPAASLESLAAGKR